MLKYDMGESCTSDHGPDVQDQDLTLHTPSGLMVDMNAIGRGVWTSVSSPARLAEPL